MKLATVFSEAYMFTADEDEHARHGKQSIASCYRKQHERKHIGGVEPNPAIYEQIEREVSGPE